MQIKARKRDKIRSCNKCRAAVIVSLVAFLALARPVAKAKQTSTESYNEDQNRQDKHSQLAQIAELMNQAASNETHSLPAANLSDSSIGTTASSAEDASTQSVAVNFTTQVPSLLTESSQPDPNVIMGDQQQASKEPAGDEKLVESATGRSTTSEEPPIESSSNSQHEQDPKPTELAQVDFTPELLQDDSHEADKLRYRQPPANIRQAPTPKLEMQGWRAANSDEPFEQSARPAGSFQFRPQSSQLRSRPNMLIEHQAKHLAGVEQSRQSSLQPQHVSPPQTDNQQWLRRPEAEFVAHLPTSYLLRQVKQSVTEAPAVEQSQRAAFVSSLKAKSRGLIPRLASKLFGQQESQLEPMKQQQSFQVAMHNSPLVSSKPAKSNKLFPSSRLVKNLLDPILPTRPAPSEAPQQPQSAISQSRLVYVNGQVYSVVSPVTRPATASNNLAFFDHQTSDSSEFPVFEAMSMQHTMRPVATTAHSSSSSSQRQVRCDRPRHIIQADRLVVDHILQSQQNFVITRVPIKKYVRPEMSVPISSQQQHFQPLPMNMMAAMSSPATSQSGQTQALPGYSLTQQVPVYQAPSIEVHRQSIWQSLANLISGLRSRRPEMQQATIVAGSSPPAMVVEGPLIFASRRDRRARRLGSSARNLFVQTPQFVTAAASMANGQFAGSTDSEPPADPMRRLLMLKTASDDEVCSPIGQLNNKIKYSCVPNSCVALALANLASNQQSQAQAHINSNLAYKTSNSMQDYSQQWPNQNQAHQSNEDQVEVQQFDDLPSSQIAPPLVTYTHINAYHQSALSKLAQPQHQQFASTTQALDALANNESNLADDDNNDWNGPQNGNSLYQPQASNQPLISPGRVYLNYSGIVTSGGFQPAGGGRTSERPSTTSSPRVAFGTAYIRPTSAPVQRQRTAGREARATSKPNKVRVESSAGGSVETAQFDSHEPSGVEEPSEFVSAVDDKLEKPIRVSEQKWRTEQQPAENGGASAENSPVTSRPRFRPKSNIYKIDQPKSLGDSPIYSNLAPAQMSSNNQQLRRPERPEASSDYGRVGDEDDDQPEYESQEEEEVESPNMHQQQRPNQPPMEQQSHQSMRPNQASVINVSQPIRLPSLSQHRRERKTRRDNHKLAAHTTAAPTRYGQRQTTPLPPPEKSEEPEVASVGSFTDEDSASNNSTDCDCQKTQESDKSDTEANQLDRPASGPSEEQHVTSKPRANSKRNPTTLRPIKQRQLDVESKDRRQTPVIKEVTKRPYNLRNTTYKNMPSSSTESSSMLSTSHLSSPQSIQPLSQRGDISITTATPKVLFQHEHNKQTHFDEDSSVARQELHQRANLLPPTESSERFFELGDDELKLADRARRQPDSTKQEERNTWRLQSPQATNISAQVEPDITQVIPGRQENRTLDVSSANFKPSSVNDIVAQARREKVDSGGVSERRSAESTKENPASATSEQSEDREEENDVTPHQYQIQVRWNNSSSSERLPRTMQGSGDAVLDRMRENVRDRAFEHREEEHWHDKHWERAAKRRRLVAGKWVIVPIQPPPPLPAGSLDYGPNANQRETPIGNQLSNFPSREETEQHFAIPTPNFRQNPKFVEWVQSDVDMSSDPQEPQVPKSTTLN